MTSLILLACAAVAGPSVADYFPLVPGTRWTYQETSDKSKYVLVDEVKGPVDLDGKRAFPIQTTIEGRAIEVRYYRIEGDTVYLVAFEKERPLGQPHPVLKVGEGKSTWEYRGLTQFMGGPAELVFKSEASSKGRQKVLDREVECVEVQINGSVDGGGGTKLSSRQVAIYGKGIGLVEMRERRTISRSTVESTVKLLQFEPGPGLP